MPKCLFVVRATVADAAKRAAFDAWYRDEHLPDAAKSFRAEKAWRCWSDTDPAVLSVRRPRRARPGYRAGRDQAPGRGFRQSVVGRAALARDHDDRRRDLSEW